ncbi:acyltransferase family protein [Desulfosediminicola flagellatus]|uniref:acyltransferase family protein n=1 Tax=Desulfosediminicola flagellatus TaxID=2569541 RepID=UPI0010ACBC7C|nr:acyltransferase family protein [Desulfosediminicola flagellatus]
MRDVALDNYKFLLITFVVVGHVISPLKGDYPWVKFIYMFIYIYHMPMFAYVSGAVSGNEINTRMIRKILSKLLIPYIMLEISHSLLTYCFSSKNTLEFSPLLPSWSLWYLLSLILWRILSPFVSQLKYPIIWAILMGLACGINNYDDNLSFSRTFVFFPFFLIGQHYHSNIMVFLQKFKMSRIIGGGTILGVIILLLIFPEMKDINTGWLYGNKSYLRLGVDWQHGVLYRFVIYLFAFALGMSFLSLIWKTYSVFTTFGEHSLYIYVLHGFIVKGLKVAGVYSLINQDYEIVGLIIFSLIMLPLCSSKRARYVGDTIMDPCGRFFKINLSKLLLSPPLKSGDSSKKGIIIS